MYLIHLDVFHKDADAALDRNVALNASPQHCNSIIDPLAKYGDYSITPQQPIFAAIFGKDYFMSLLI